MELQCDICFVQFDLGNHRPKCLVPCGHTICKECVQNPSMERKCPTCRTDLVVDAGDHPDNVLAIRLMEDDAAPPRKKQRKEDAKVQQVQQLQRGVEAGRKVVEALQRVVPQVVEAVHRQLDASVAQLRQMEEALEKQVQPEGAGDAASTPDLSPEQLQMAAKFEDGLRLLSTSKCSVVAEEEGGSTWTTSAQLGGIGDMLRVLLLQSEADGQLEKGVNVAGPATPASYVVPPLLISTLQIKDSDLEENGVLKVNDILRDGKRWKDVRSVRGLHGCLVEELFFVVAQQLEELEITDLVSPKAMEEVRKMSSLKRLRIMCNDRFDVYPDLPLQLEELVLYCPKLNQMHCLGRMERLRSLKLSIYAGPNVTFPPSPRGELRWLSVNLDTDRKPTMLSLIRANASSLQEIHVRCGVSGSVKSHFFPDLGRELAECGVQSLRRLVLWRPIADHCLNQVALCLVQRRTIRSFLPSSVEVVCDECHNPLS